jgi:hypothetical protein
MRGADEQTGALFSYLSPEALVPRQHPLRSIRRLVNEALERPSGKFDTLLPTAAGPRLYTRSCYVPCCCKRFMACVPSVS